MLPREVRTPQNLSVKFLGEKLTFGARRLFQSRMKVWLDVDSCDS